MSFLRVGFQDFIACIVFVKSSESLIDDLALLIALANADVSSEIFIEAGIPPIAFINASESLIDEVMSLTALNLSESSNVVTAAFLITR